MIIAGDAVECLRLMPAEIAHCCVTSPPYYGLRDYGVAGQVGLEPTPEAYVARMVEVFGEVRRVLRKDGTLWLNIGDSYAGSNSKEGSAKRLDRMFRGNRRDSTARCKPKDLIGIPWMLAFALRADGWYLRRDIIWHKPNPMPESVTDRPTTAHEYLFLLTKSARYFYDAEAIKEPATRAGKVITLGEKSLSRGQARGAGVRPSGNGLAESVTVADRRNKRSVWTITPQPFREAHFATFPPALVEPCILAGTSAKGVCPTCGAPWVRVLKQRKRRGAYNDHSQDSTAGMSAPKPNSLNGQRFYDEFEPAETIDWRASCDHPALNPVPSTVLDPFFGAGTTGLVAQELGRDCVGIELNPAYAPMAHRRIEAARRPIKEAA